ncbi:MAG TPA: RsmE family RNA methyltransferase [Acidimicrobiia bacterium]|nr:RsmE family RNA methyltransferase [Acidimicrobiia bacterium]
MTRFAALYPATAHTFLPALDDDVTLDDEAGHHLSRVRRVRAGEAVTAADGDGRWRPYAVRGVRPGAVELHAQGAPVVEPQLEPRLVVAFALTKGTKPDLAVQKLTELGVDGVTLLSTRRSIPRWSGSRAHAALARLRRIAREAAAQCRRARLPEIDGVLPVTELRGRSGLVVADPAGEELARLPAPPGGEWVLVIGPEGGFDPDEVAAMTSPAEDRHGPVRLRLRPHVLRAETAAIAGAAVLATRRAPPVGQ